MRHLDAVGWTAEEYAAAPEMAERLHKRILELQDALDDIADSCEFFLSSAEKFGEEEPYGMRTVLNRVNAHRGG